jgi:hypothetical protein
VQLTDTTKHEWFNSRPTVHLLYFKGISQPHPRESMSNSQAWTATSTTSHPITMATLDLSSLATRLEGLGLAPIPQFSEAHVLNKPLDIGRSYLADILRSLIDCDPITAYNSIQWPNDISTADLTVPLPKLSHGADSTTLAIDLMQRVRRCLPYTVSGPISLTTRSIVPKLPPFHLSRSRRSPSSDHVQVKDASPPATPLH